MNRRGECQKRAHCPQQRHTTQYPGVAAEGGGEERSGAVEVGLHAGAARHEQLEDRQVARLRRVVHRRVPCANAAATHIVLTDSTALA